MFKVDSLIKKAKMLNKTIVFPEADISERVLKAAEIVIKKKIAKVLLLGNPESLAKKSNKIKDWTIQVWHIKKTHCQGGHKFGSMYQRS